MHTPSWFFIAFILLLSPVSGALVYLYGDPNAPEPSVPIVLTGNASQLIDLDGDGENDANISIVTGGGTSTISNFRVGEANNSGLQVAGDTAALAFPLNLSGLTATTATRLESELGIGSVTDFKSANNHYFASSSDLATPSDAEWSNDATSAPVTGVAAVRFDNRDSGIPATILGFIKVEVDETNDTLSIISYGYDSLADPVPEPSTVLLALIGSISLIVRRRS